MQGKNQIEFTHGRKKTRGELRLPQLHFVAVDQWLHTLGNHAFVAWLQFYSWADRTDKDRETDAIPNSMSAIAKKLGVSKETLYKKIIRPLWNHGMIDLTETQYTGYSNVNVIVYEYPRNDPALATKELVQVRDYDTQYESAAREKAIRITEQREKQRQIQQEGQFGNRTGGSSEIEPGGSSEIEPGAVRKSNRGSSEIEPINEIQESLNDHEYKKQQQDKNVVVLTKKIESHLGKSINSLIPLLKKWIENYGEEYLLEKAQYVGSTRPKWQNIIGTYRNAVTENYDTVFTEVAVTSEKQHGQEDRYSKFYSLFSDT